MLAADAVQRANSGHPGLPLGAADLATVLWMRFLKHNPADPTWPNRDRFVLSAGHGSALLYALLHLSGYPMPLDEIKRFRQWGSLTPGHPEYDLEGGVETTTGPLGQGLGNAVGMALAERWLAARFNAPGFPIVEHFTYVLASDGDLMEGVSHEAASLAGHLGLSRLIVLYDDNHISIDGPTDLTYSDDVPGRFAAYGWHTQQVDGHDMAAVDAAIRAAKAETKRPSLIACRTHIGYGSPRQDTARVHGEPLGEEDLRLTKEAFDWPPEPRFHIPSEVRCYVDKMRKASVARQAEWEALLPRYRAAHPDLAAKWDMVVNGQLPPGWASALPTFDEKPLATRAASGQVLDAIAPHLPMLLGGSADLTGSNKTRPAGAEAVRRGDFSGSYVHFGVREHGMGAILNGLALHGGVRPYGGTFLVFSDYMRPTIRLAAMMGLPVIYVFTHDSIGLGEDGPTHQPVEHLMSLRTIPNLAVIRPADGNETALAWRVALERRDGPTALCLTRQGLPQVTATDNDLARGAYVLAEAEGGTPDVVLIASGSEVSLALAAQEQLAGEGIGVRVVSMPSWELFDAQPDDYRARVLPASVPRLAVEAGVTLAWARYVGEGGKVIGLDRFGASAPYMTLFEQFGFTVEDSAQQARKLVR
ncbi:MAG: transketolase [Anaerolineae bacterium]|nr:MAG: transketolase [Anaerolineae bacterium]